MTNNNSDENEENEVPNATETLVSESNKEIIKNVSSSEKEIKNASSTKTSKKIKNVSSEKLVSESNKKIKKDSSSKTSKKIKNVPSEKLVSDSNKEIKNVSSSEKLASDSKKEIKNISSSEKLVGDSNKEIKNALSKKTSKKIKNVSSEKSVRESNKKIKKDSSSKTSKKLKNVSSEKSVSESNKEIKNVSSSKTLTSDSKKELKIASSSKTLASDSKKEIKNVSSSKTLASDSKKELKNVSSSKTLTSDSKKELKNASSSKTLASDSNKEIKNVSSSKTLASDSKKELKNASSLKTSSIFPLASYKSKSKTGEDLKNIPSKGDLLLDWVRNRMSVVIEDEDNVSTDEEELHLQTAEEEKKRGHGSKTKREEKTKKNKDKKRKANKKRQAVPENISFRLPRPEGMTDEVLKMIKKKKEEKMMSEKASSVYILQSERSISRSIKSKEGTSVTKTKKRRKAKEVKKTPSSKSPIQMEIEKRMQEMKMEEENKEDLALIESIKAVEQTKRIEGLGVSLDFIKCNEEYNKNLELEESEENYWKLYVKCGPLPIVNHISEMTSYLELWKKKMVETTIEIGSKRTRDGLKLLSVLHDFIENKPAKNEKQLENYIWLKGILRELLSEMMDVLTFNLLADVERNLIHLTLSTGEFNHSDENFTINLWLKFQLPKPLFNPRKPIPPPIRLSFKNLKLDMELPQSISGEAMAIRTMYLIYDHLSDSSESFQRPPKPEYYSYNLVDVLEKEWRVKQKYKVLGRYRAQYERELQRQEINLMVKANLDELGLETAPPDLPPIPKFQLPVVDIEGEIPEVPTTIKLDPTPEEYAETLEEMEFNEMKKNLRYTPGEFEINLRKYTILGGLFVTNLFYQPPQPQQLVTMELTVSRFILPKKLEEVEFYESFATLPPSDEQKSPEELESAIRLQEEGFAKLISITLSFPTHVMYLEPPVVCMWEEEHKFWSTRDIHDVKQNEEKGMVSFRAGRFGVFGLATFRYGNLPYQTWEIKPDSEGNIIFQLNAAIIMFEFKVQGKFITVTQFQNGPNNAMQDIVSRSFSLTELAKIFREGGVDIFPDYDAFCYVEGSCEKHWPTEYICYYNMAQLSICYNFSWSRWNATEGFRSIVMQMRIYNTEQIVQKPQNLVLVTPLRAAFINCTEVAPIFCDDPVEGSKFSCTLWHLMKSTSTIYVRNKIKEISQETIYTVAQLLIGTRILSFS